MNQLRVQKEVPKNKNPNYQSLIWCPRCRTNDHLIRNCPQLEKVAAEQSKMQQQNALECPNYVPGLVSSMITISVTIDGIEMTTCVDTRAAANMCTQEEAYKVHMNGEAVFREGAWDLLSLTVFGGSKVHIEETFFAACIHASRRLELCLTSCFSL